MGTLMVRPRYAHGPFKVQSQPRPRFVQGTLTVSSRYAHGTFKVHSESPLGTLTVRSRYTHSHAHGSRYAKGQL